MPATAPDDDVPVVVLEIPARVEMVGLARQVVGDLATHVPALDSTRAFDVRLVVSEAVTNAVEAHERVGRETSIDVTCWLHPDRIEVSVCDHGGGIERSISEMGELDHESERGRGVALMHRLADDVNFTATEWGTHVAITVRAGEASVSA